MTRVTRVTVDRTCAICERTLLMGEHAIRFSPNGGSDYVDVCPLCAETAVEYGWIRGRLSEDELSMVEAADLFNASQYRRTVGGIAKSLGEPRVSVIVLSGVNAEVVVTVAWDISWYQYRVSPESDNPVRLEGRGHDPAELETSFAEWNAHLDAGGRVVPDIARL